ncbi:hypothetical protein AVEN_145480-1 [Araneus ventricosus]|uniref:Uncharacterized protein n=1 Tax=Araneus ventricosus TaxID=182803 RepID=A0A4Y2I793_ARAVE|nr:hypothetical protein AVEN_145480-1 [Araneus ventricosus]
MCHGHVLPLLRSWRLDQYPMLLLYRIPWSSCISRRKKSMEGMIRIYLRPCDRSASANPATRKKVPASHNLRTQVQTIEDLADVYLGRVLGTRNCGLFISTHDTINVIHLRRFCVTELNYPSSSSASSEMIVIPDLQYACDHRPLTVVGLVSEQNFLVCRRAYKVCKRPFETPCIDILKEVSQKKY